MQIFIVCWVQSPIAFDTNLKAKYPAQIGLGSGTIDKTDTH
jgi:hypothetical protein